MRPQEKVFLIASEKHESQDELAARLYHDHKLWTMWSGNWDDFIALPGINWVDWSAKNAAGIQFYPDYRHADDTSYAVMDADMSLQTALEALEIKIGYRPEFLVIAHD